MKPINTMIFLSFHINKAFLMSLIRKWVIITKPRPFVNLYVQCSNCTKFEGLTLNNGLRKAQNVMIGYWIIMQVVNSLTPGKFEWNLKYLIFKRILVMDGWGISCGIALIWMSLDFTDDQSTLVQVMAWCHQATSHYLSQWWPRSVAIWHH